MGVFREACPPLPVRLQALAGREGLGKPWVRYGTGPILQDLLRRYSVQKVYRICKISNLSAVAAVSIDFYFIARKTKN